MVDSYKQQGYIIRQKNSEYNYLVIEDPATSRAVRTAEAQAAAATRQAAQQGVSSAAAALVAESRQRIGSRPTADSRSPRDTAVAALMAINSAKARLSGVAGVSAVQHNPQVQLFGRFTPGSHHLSAGTVARQRRRLNTATSCPDDTFEKYAAALGYPDLVIGRSSEQAPYGISMVQANYSTMVDISSTYRDKVLFCVIDDGMDASNPEFTAGRYPATRPFQQSTSRCILCSMCE